MAAHHSDGFPVLFGEEIGNVRARDVTVEDSVEPWPVEYRVFEAAYHLINDLAVSGRSATDSNCCMHVLINWVERGKLHRAALKGKNTGYFSGHARPLRSIALFRYLYYFNIRLQNLNYI